MTCCVVKVRYWTKKKEKKKIWIWILLPVLKLRLLDRWFRPFKKPNHPKMKAQRNSMQDMAHHKWVVIIYMTCCCHSMIVLYKITQYETSWRGCLKFKKMSAHKNHTSVFLFPFCFLGRDGRSTKILGMNKL